MGIRWDKDKRIKVSRSEKAEWEKKELCKEKKQKERKTK